MELIDKLQLFKDKGYTYNYLTGDIISHKGKTITGVNDRGYIICTLLVDKKPISVKGHILAWYLFYNKLRLKQIDHINGIKNDNRIVNLRDITIQENMFNKNAKGYYYHKGNKKWRVHIGLNNKIIQLGEYERNRGKRCIY